ncbi:MBL fold metallo-hydrolase [Syntrophomonas erecta]
MLIPLAQNTWVVCPAAKPRYPYANSIFLQADRPAVIDLGAGRQAYSGITQQNVKLALVSHFHFDHIHSYSLFPQADLLVSQEEYPTYIDEQEYVSFHGYDLWNKLMPGMERQRYGKVVPLSDDIPMRPGFHFLNPSGVFKDMQKIDLGNREIVAIHLPGHTAGHYGFFLEKEGILYSGDIDLVASGPWYSSNSADIEDLINSVKKIKEVNPAVIVPAHRHIQNKNLHQQLDHYIQVVIDRQSRILELLRKPRTLDQLAEEHLVLPQRHNLYELFWEKMTIRNHLGYLLRTGQITELPGGFYQSI